MLTGSMKGWRATTRQGRCKGPWRWRTAVALAVAVTLALAGCREEADGPTPPILVPNAPTAAPAPAAPVAPGTPTDPAAQDTPGTPGAVPAGGAPEGAVPTPTAGGGGSENPPTAPADQAGGAGSAPAVPVMVDYALPGPHEVLVEKNVGEPFRNGNVQDDSDRCAAFVGLIELPGEGDVDEELTNYPADMDRQLYTMFRPAVLAEGMRYPVITWGNGTCAQPLLYNEILEHLASHGFIVIASNATNVGSGTEMLGGVDFVLSEAERPDSPLFGKVDLERIGASGHSQGSNGTVVVGSDPRIQVTVPIQGASASGVRSLNGPSFLISGETDTLVTPSSVESAFEAATVPAVYGMSVGQDHLMPGRMPEPILEALTAWFAIHLLDDDLARPLFEGDDCGLCSDAGWEIQRRNL